MGRLRTLLAGVGALFEEDAETNVDQEVFDRIWEAHSDPSASRTLNVLAFEGEWEELTIEEILADLKHCNDSVVLQADIPVLEDTGYFRYTAEGWEVSTRYDDYSGAAAEEFLDALHDSAASEVLPAPIEESPFG